MFGRWIQNQEWTEVYEAKDVQSKADAFNHVINEGITTIFPIKTVRVHIRDKPWMTDRVKSLIPQRQKAFALGDRATRVVLRNKVIREIRKAKRSYTSKKIRKLQKSNPGKWHKEVRNLANMKRPDPTIHVSGINATDHVAIANAINMHLASLFNSQEPLDLREHLGNIQ